MPGPGLSYVPPKISDRLAGSFVPRRGIQLVVNGHVYELPSRGEVRWNTKAETAWLKVGDKISILTAEGSTPGDVDGLTVEHWALL